MYRYVLYMHPTEKEKLLKLLENWLLETGKQKQEIDDEFMLIMALVTRLQLMEQTFIG